MEGLDLAEDLVDPSDDRLDTLSRPKIRGLNWLQVGLDCARHKSLHDICWNHLAALLVVSRDGNAEAFSLKIEHRCTAVIGRNGGGDFEGDREVARADVIAQITPRNKGNRQVQGLSLANDLQSHERMLREGLAIEILVAHNLFAVDRAKDISLSQSRLKR